MALIKNQIQVQEYEYDFAVDGGATGVKTLSAKDNKVKLPAGAVRLSATVLVQDALLGSGASAKLGTTASDVVFAANAAIASYSANAVFNATTPAYVSATGGDCLLTIAGGALTAGKLKVLVSFIVPNS
jgi:hypothetical protein